MGEKALANLQSPLPPVPQVVLPEDQSVVRLPSMARLTTVAFSQKVEIQVPDWLLTEPPTWSTWGCAIARLNALSSRTQPPDFIAACTAAWDISGVFQEQRQQART